MRDDKRSERTEPSDAKGVRDQIRDLETQIGPENSRVQDRIDTFRDRLRHYEDADADAHRSDSLEDLQSELLNVRETVEDELDEGKRKAQDIIDEIETKVSDLRQSE